MNRGQFHEFDYANPAFNEIIKCIGTNFARVGKKKIFRFPETDDYWHEPAIIVGHHRQRNRPPQPTQLFAADEIVLPLICIIQRAREQCRILPVSWNRACRRKRTKG